MVTMRVNINWRDSVHPAVRPIPMTMRVATPTTNVFTILYVTARALCKMWTAMVVTNTVMPVHGRQFRMVRHQEQKLVHVAHRE